MRVSRKCVHGATMHFEFPPRLLHCFLGPNGARDLRAAIMVVWAARCNKNHLKRISVAQDMARGSVAQDMARGRNVAGFFLAGTVCVTQCNVCTCAWWLVRPMPRDAF